MAGLYEDLYGEPQGLTEQLYGVQKPIKIGVDALGDVVRDEMRNRDWATRNIIGAGSALTSAWEGLKDIVGKSDPSQVAADKVIAAEAPVGNIAGNVAMLAPTALIPGVNTVTGAGVLGALAGGLLTPGDLKNRAIAAGLGAGGGAAGAGLSKALQATRPVTVNPDAAMLAQEGISLTPGQNAGGFLKNVEDKLTSVPGVGNVIDAARRRGIEDFNQAAIRRVTQPLDSAGIPIATNGIGHDGVAALRTGLGQAYDDVLSRSSANALEPQFVQKMANLRQMVSGMPQREQAAFDAIIEREIGQRMAPNGMLNSENLQAAKSGIGQQISNFGTSTDAYQRQLGQALKQADEEFRQLVSRANPKNAKDLAAIDTAYANFKRIQKAASGVGTESGVFTPAQLNSAVKAMDRTKDKRAFSEGTALLQDLSNAGKTTLPSKVPDSGTAGRMMQNIFSLSGLLSTVPGMAAAVPAYLAYSRPGTAAINWGMNNALKPGTETLRSLLANNPNLWRLGGISAASKLAGQQ